MLPARGAARRFRRAYLGTCRKMGPSRCEYGSRADFLRSCSQVHCDRRSTMYNERQLQIVSEITRGLGLTEPAPGAVVVEQSPSYVDSVVEVADLAVAALGTIGSTVAAIGDRRGLGPQQVRIDRRHAQLLFNDVAYFFQSGWQFDLGTVFTPVNSFYRTRDDREIFFNGAYKHLRDGILRFLDCPEDHAAIALRVA